MQVRDLPHGTRQKMDQLPAELLREVLGHLAPRDLARLGCVSRYFSPRHDQCGAIKAWPDELAMHVHSGMHASVFKWLAAPHVGARLVFLRLMHRVPPSTFALHNSSALETLMASCCRMPASVASSLPTSLRSLSLHHVTLPAHTRVFRTSTFNHLGNLEDLDLSFQSGAFDVVVSGDALPPRLTHLALRHCPGAVIFPSSLPRGLQELVVQADGWVSHVENTAHDALPFLPSSLVSMSLTTPHAPDIAAGMLHHGGADSLRTLHLAWEEGTWPTTCLAAIVRRALPVAWITLEAPVVMAPLQQMRDLCLESGVVRASVEIAYITAPDEELVHALGDGGQLDAWTFFQRGVSVRY